MAAVVDDLPPRAASMPFVLRVGLGAQCEIDELYLRYAEVAVVRYRPAVNTVVVQEVAPLAVSYSGEGAA
jgi:hypothetical protein